MASIQDCRSGQLQSASVNFTYVSLVILELMEVGQISAAHHAGRCHRNDVIQLVV